MRRRSNESRTRGAEIDETGGLHVPVLVAQIVERLVAIEEPTFSFIRARTRTALEVHILQNERQNWDEQLR